MVSKGQFVGLDWNRITRLHSQVMIGTQEVKNSLTASRCHLKAYPRCGQPTSKVSILKMKQQHDNFNQVKNDPRCCHLLPAPNISGFIAQLVRASHRYREVTG